MTVTFPVENNGKRPLIKKWQEIKESVQHLEGQNYGIKCSNHTVVDLDVKGEVNGVKIFQELFGNIDTYTVKTPSGGYHLYFALEPEFKNWRNINKSSVDIRSGPDGYVVGPGSKINGKSYVIEKDIPVIPMPGNVRDWLLKDKKKTDEEEKIETGSIHEGPEVSYIQKLLDLLDDDWVEDYDSWFKTVRALKFIGIEYNLDLEELAHDWSSKSSKYKYSETKKVWNAPTEGIDPITLGSLKFWVKEQNPDGYCATHPKTVRPDEFQYYRDYHKLIDATKTDKVISYDYFLSWINACITIIEQGGNKYVLTRNKKRNDEGEDQVYHAIVKHERMMKNLIWKVIVTNPDFNDNEKESRNNKRYLNVKEAFIHAESEKLIKNFDKCTMYPYLDTAPNLYDTYNTFSPYFYRDYQPTKKIDFTQTPMYRHIRDELCNGDIETFNYLQWWIAHMIREPSNTCGVFVVIVSPQGGGKDLFAKLIGKLIGVDYVVKFSKIAQFFKDFNGEQSGKILTVVGELKGKGGQGFENYEMFKDKITKGEIRVERKGMEVVHERSVNHYMLFSNNRDCMYVENSDRRCFMVEASPKKCNDRAYFAPLWKMLKDKDFMKAAFNYYAYDLDLPENFEQMKAPMTELKRENKKNAMPNLLKFFDDCDLEEWEEMYRWEENFKATNKGMVMKSQWLYERFSQWCKDTGVRNIISKFKMMSQMKEHFKLESKVYKIGNVGGVKIDGTMRGYRFTAPEIREKIEKYLH
jgi:hypothetical protein